MSAVRLLCALIALALAAGCGDRQVGLRVGTKDFAEQEILGEMLSRLLQHRGHGNVTLVQCRDTYGCQRQLNDGAVDLMVEYSGTGLSFLGVGDDGVRPSMDRVRQSYLPLGLNWLEPLGFDNGYRVLVTPQRASALGIRAISDLASLEGGVRVACPSEYLRRPLDGLAALVKRYGLRVQGKPLVINDPGERFQALLDGKADVAVGYATDADIASLGLRELADPLGFFPPYEAAVVVRTALLDRSPGIRDHLRPLEGRIDTKTMRRLNYQVQVEGQTAAAVARRFLQRSKLIKAQAPDKSRPRMVIALHRQDGLEHLVTLATKAVRAVFPNRAVVTVPSDDPPEDLVRARARLAVLGAEKFFRYRGQGPPRREDRIEALTVLGDRMVHLISKNGASDPLAGRVGVGPRGSGGAGVADRLLDMSGRKAARHAPVAELLSAVAKGKLDAALLLAIPGEAALARGVARWNLKVRPLSNHGAARWLGPERAVLQPFLRPARIPAGTYAGQTEPVETLGTQVLLAGPSPGAQHRLSVGGGPAAAPPTGGRPFTLKQAQQMAQAAGATETPDPVLPSAWAVRASVVDGGEQSDDGQLFDTLLNVIGIAFLVWVAVLVLRRSRKEQD